METTILFTFSEIKFSLGTEFENLFDRSLSQLNIITHDKLVNHYIKPQAKVIAGRSHNEGIHKQRQNCNGPYKYDRTKACKMWVPSSPCNTWH